MIPQDLHLGTVRVINRDLSVILLATVPSSEFIFVEEFSELIQAVIVTGKQHQYQRYDFTQMKREKGQSVLSGYVDDLRHRDLGEENSSVVVFKACQCQVNPKYVTTSGVPTSIRKRTSNISQLLGTCGYRCITAFGRRPKLSKY